MTPPLSGITNVPRMIRGVLCALVLTVAVSALVTSVAAAAPVWGIAVTHAPSSLTRDDEQIKYQVTATNTSSSATDGTPVVVTMTAPAGMTVVHATSPGNSQPTPSVPVGWTCNTTPPSIITCTRSSVLAPNTAYPTIEFVTAVTGEPSDPATMTATVSGGGAPAAGTTDNVNITPGLGFGVTAGTFIARVLDASGSADYTQAGGHPVSAVESFSMQQHLNATGAATPTDHIATADTQLPAGFVGNPEASPTKCPSIGRILSDTFASPGCPQTSIVGGADALTSTGNFLRAVIYSVTPERGAPAEFMFGYTTTQTIYTLKPKLRPEDGYAISVVADGISKGPALYNVAVTLCGFGTKIAAHGPGAGFLGTEPGFTGCKLPTDAGANPIPLLTNPPTCPVAGPITRLNVTSWENPDTSKAAEAQAPPPTGCGQVQFTPTVGVTPATTTPDSATGLDAQIDVPTDGLLTANGISQAHLKKAVVTLPDGISVNPSGAAGLQACSDDQLKLGTDSPTTCPDGSKIGTADITTPILAEHLTGDVVLRTPTSTDPESGDMFRLAIIVKSDERGILVKLPGSAVADRNTGRLTATFDNNPQLPFSDLQVHLKGGPRGMLATPHGCGPLSTSATLTPWSDNDPVSQSTDATIAGDCGNAFAPVFDAGSSSQTPGGSGSYSLKFSRADGSQYFKGLTATLPNGLLADVGSVPLCSDDDAAAGTCPESSRIGSADASAGSGDPFVLEKKGDVYLTESYKGGAYGLMVKVPVEAGPFTGAMALPTQIIRQALFVDKFDAHVTAVSDDFPQVVAGIPLRIRSVTVNIDRPGFMRNPTSCEPGQTTATLSSTQGASANVSAPFSMSGCDALPFRPTMTSSTSDKLAFKKGASMKVHIAMPGGDANIKSVETTLPKQLPSRLIPTINNACVYDQYVADYTSCPADSYIGTVTAVSPLIAEPLTGPAYIVAPPNDVPRIALKLFGQGAARNVEVDLEGKVIVDIGDGRSQVTFDTVPDVPVTSFDLDLPAGDHSILDAPSHDLCSGPIQMFVRLTAQNGKTDDGYKTVTVSDCQKIAKPKVVSAKTTAATVRLRVLAPSEGRLVVSGNGLKTVARTVNRKLTYTVSVPLSPAGKRAVSRKGRLKTRPLVYFKPVNAPKASTVKTKKSLIVKKHVAKKTSKKHTAKKSASRFWINW